MSEAGGVDDVVWELAESFQGADVFGRMSDERVVTICEELARVAAEYFGEKTEYSGEKIVSAEICGARVAIETVQAYGLSIGVDGNGNAARVDFPYGAIPEYGEPS